MLNSLAVVSRTFFSEGMRGLYTIQQPSLPQRAGKRFVEIEEQLRHFKEHGPTPPVPISKEAKAKPGEHHVRLRVVVRPEPDMNRIAKVLLDIGKSIVEKDRTKQGDDDSKAA